MRHPFSLALLLATAALYGCADGQASQTGAPEKTYPVLTLQPSSLSLSSRHVAAIQGVKDVELKADVDGFLRRIHVDEGQFVRKGQLLFELDTDKLQEQLLSISSEIAAAEQQLSLAKLEVERVQPLVKQGIISGYELESALSNQKLNEARIAEAKARRRNLQIQIGRARIAAPADGMVGRIALREGSLVARNNMLTTLSDISRVQAYFSINEQAYLQLFQQLEGSSLQQKLAQLPPVQLELADGSLYPHQGRIETIDGQVNASTGTLRLRAVFPNPEQLIRSGSSGNVLLPEQYEHVWLVPKAATFEVLNKTFVYRVDGQQQAESISIQQVNETGDAYVVRGGQLKGGDRIVLEGADKLKEGQKLTVEEAKPTAKR